MESNKVNLKLIKIVSFQIIMNINGPNYSILSIMNLLTNAMFNIYKYQTQRKDCAKIIEFKFNYIKRIFKGLFQSCSNDEEYHKFFEMVMIKTCEYMKLYINITVPDELLFKRHEKAFAYFYLKSRYQFKFDNNKRTLIINYFKDNKYTKKNFKQLLLMFYKLINEFKPMDSSFDKKYYDLQTFIESSLIIINDPYLLKNFKKLKLDWIHKSWQ